MEEFDIKSSEELEGMSDEDRSQYEQDLDDYTQKNLDNELELQGEEEDEPKEELEEEAKVKPDASMDEDTNQNYKARYEGLTPKFNEVTEENRKLKERLDALESKIPDKKEDEPVVFDPEKYRDMMDTNPTEASKYYYEHYVKPQLQQENAQRERETSLQRAQETTVRSVQEFGQLEEVQKVMQDKPELGDAFGKYLREEVQIPGNGFTVDDLKRHWKRFRVDDLIVEKTEEAKRDVISKLNSANPETITLTNAKDSKSSKTDLKKMNRNTAAEFGESLEDEDLDKLLDERLG